MKITIEINPYDLDTIAAVLATKECIQSSKREYKKQLKDCVEQGVYDAIYDRIAFCDDEIHAITEEVLKKWRKK